MMFFFIYLSYSKPVSFGALIDRSKHIRKPRGGDGDSTVFCVDELLSRLFIRILVCFMTYLLILVF